MSRASVRDPPLGARTLPSEQLWHRGSRSRRGNGHTTLPCPWQARGRQAPPPPGPASSAPGFLFPIKWGTFTSSPKGSASGHTLAARIALGPPRVKSGGPEHEHRDTVTVNLMTRQPLSDQQAGSVYGVGTLGRGKSHILGGTGWDGAEFHHTMQNGMQFTTEELFISGIFHSIFWGRDRPRAAETAESETPAKGPRSHEASDGSKGKTGLGPCHGHGPEGCFQSGPGTKSVRKRKGRKKPEEREAGAGSV